jgi:hypothetical protein
LAIWVFERCPRFSRPISLDPSYIYRYVGGLLSFVLFKHHLDPSSYYSFGGPSFLHTIHVLVIQLAWTPSYIYVGGLLSFVLSKNHLDPSSYYYTFGGLLSFIPSKRNVTKKQCFFEAYENLNFGRFHVLAALNWGPLTKTISKCNLIHASSRVVKVHARGPLALLCKARVL